MPTLFSGINLALQTMLSHQVAISVVEHNIANANVDGYRRQQSIFATGPAYPPPSMHRAGMVGQLGSGVVVSEIRRFNLEFFDGRYRTELAESSRYSISHDILSQVELALSETGDNSLSAKLDGFWTGWQTLSADPANTAVRADLLFRAKSLVEGINKRAVRLQEMRQDQNATVVQRVADINDIASEIAALNAQISNVQSIGDQPNDLLDERDRLLDRLSEIAGADSSLQENGQVLVSISGHALVIGYSTFTLSASSGVISNITWDDGAMPFSVTTGELKGLLDARDVIIPAQQTGLDDLALMLRDEVNALHRTGYDLNDNQGLDFFSGTDAISMRVDIDIADLEDIAAAAEDPNNPGTGMIPGDGTVAGLLAALQNKLLMGAGPPSMTLNEFYINQVATLGNEILHAENNVDAHQLVAYNLDARRESYSGVSMDEEAANLLVHQRSYQAAARLLTVVDEMIDQVINRMGRAGL